jgi:hypothetical protein
MRLTMTQRNIAIQPGETTVTAALRAVAGLAGGVVTHTTDGAHSDGSYHYSGRAVDIALASGPTWDSKLLGEVAQKLLKMVPLKFIAEFIWSGPNPVYVKNGRHVAAYASAQHHNHIHFAASSGFTYVRPKEITVDPNNHVAQAKLVALVATPTGKGYWMVTADGAVFGFGDAEYFGRLTCPT